MNLDFKKLALFKTGYPSRRGYGNFGSGKQAECVITMVNDDHFDPYMLRPVGIVRSTLKQREDCPHQGWEGAPDAWVEIDSAFVDGLDGITPGCEVV